jgi:hypothetical protein
MIAPRWTRVNRSAAGSLQRIPKSRASGIRCWLLAEPAGEPGLHDLREQDVADEHRRQEDPIERREGHEAQGFGEGGERQPGSPVQVWWSRELPVGWLPCRGGSTSRCCDQQSAIPARRGWQRFDRPATESRRALRLSFRRARLAPPPNRLSLGPGLGIPPLPPPLFRRPTPVAAPGSCRTSPRRRCATRSDS